MILRNLAVAFYIQGHTCWWYTESRPLAELLVPGHLDDAVDMLSVRDVVVVSGSNGTTMVQVSSICSSAPRVVLSPMGELP